MKRWVIAALVCVLCGAGAYLVISKKEMPPTDNVLETPTVAASPSPIPSAPVVLAQVVEVTDLDSLLDPPAKPLTGPLFDPDETTAPKPAPAAPPVPDRIPPANEDEPEGKESSTCGYEIGRDAQYDSSIRTVFVRDIVNTNLGAGPLRGIEIFAREELVRQIGQMTPFKVVSDLAKADTELICVIVSIQKNVMNVTREENTLQEGELAMKVDVIWRDLHNGKNLSISKKPGTPQELSRCDQVAKPLEKANTSSMEPRHIVATGRYMMELGETTATAAQRVEIDLAEQVVSLMEKQP